MILLQVNTERKIRIHALHARIFGIPVYGRLVGSDGRGVEAHLSLQHQSAAGRDVPVFAQTDIDVVEREITLVMGIDTHNDYIEKQKYIFHLLVPKNSQIHLHYQTIFLFFHLSKFHI